MSASKAITKLKAPQSLIDLIEPPNEVLKFTEVPGGFRFRFADRKLPPWFKALAKKSGLEMVDNDVNQRRSGRTVSLLKNTQIIDREFIG